MKQLAKTEDDSKQSKITSFFQPTPRRRAAETVTTLQQVKRVKVDPPSFPLLDSTNENREKVMEDAGTSASKVEKQSPPAAETVTTPQEVKRVKVEPPSFPLLDSTNKIREKIMEDAGTSASKVEKKRPCRFCDMTYADTAGRAQHEGKYHEFERGYFGNCTKLQDRASTFEMFEKWSPTFPDGYQRVDSKSGLGVYLKEPDNGMTVMSFHLELGSRNVSTAEVRSVFSKHHGKTYRHFKKDQSMGHLIPINSCRDSIQYVKESYDLINFAPQNAELNSTLWRFKEDHGIKLCEHWNVSTLTGVALPAGKATRVALNGNYYKVPSHWWSVIILEREGTETMYDAFLVPNENPSQDFWKFRCPIKEIEDATGLKFFTRCDKHPKNISEEGKRLDFEALCKAKPHACKDCSERFQTKDALRNHKILHSDPDKFKENREKNRKAAEKSNKK